MNRITFDLLPGQHGPDVVNLHDALRSMLESNAFDIPEQDRMHYLERLRTERQEVAYGDATAKMVAIFQLHRDLPETGEVREDTARAMNDLLERLGAFGNQPTQPRNFLVAGRVTDQDGVAYPGLQVTAYHAAEAGSIRLGLDRSDQDGRYTIQFEELRAIPQIQLVVEATVEHGAVVARSDRQPLHELVTWLDLSATRPAAQPPQSRVEGRLVLDNGGPASELALRLYRLQFGGDAELLCDGQTNDAGDYALSFDAIARTVTLDVRAVDVAGAEVKLSKPLVFSPDTRVLQADLVAPAGVQPAAVEYTRLTAALTSELGDLNRLADAQENYEQRDLSDLSGATRWDARPIALAATALKLERDGEIDLPAQAMYGLFRAGLPRDKYVLARTDPADVGVALTQLVEHGIVAMTPNEITDTTNKFTEVARTIRLGAPVPGSQTTYSQMLQTAGLNGAGETFADVYLKYRGDPAGLWQAAREAAVPEEAISKLQWQGKLAFLAGSSGKVTSHLMSKLEGAPLAAGKPAALQSPAALVSHDLYDAEQWKNEVRALAADDEELGALIPDAYGGETVDGRLDAYAADMARKVRISYPTEVVTRMVETDKIALSGAKDATVKLLQAAAPQGFSVGSTPVERFLASGMSLPDGMTDADVDTAKQEIRKLQRVYQITPTNEAMPVLKELGLESAFDVTALTEQEFYRIFDKKYVEVHGKNPAEPEKKLIWRKAQQVSAMTYNIFGVTKKVDTYYPVTAVSGNVERRDKERDDLHQALKGYPTMEELFGSMDFCECEHCRSVLSPAAYLVDLLQFVEAEPVARANFLAGWQERNGKSYSEKYLDPYEALIKRRPDLPHVPLTCENTNVALPYIDVVNEILEYFVAHDQLSKDAARDTGDATTAELLAEPQNVIAAAYEQLLGETFPLTMPFDLWLQTVREFCTYTETPLHRVLETFRPSEQFLPAAPDYGWAGIFLESLGLSPAERAIFTDGDPLATWWTLYGYDTEAQATTEDFEDGQRVDLNSARALSRRLGVNYKELVELVKTTFVNPDLVKLGVLYKLPATIAELQEFLKPENQQFLDDNKELLGADLTPAQQAEMKALSDEDWGRLANLGGFADRVKAYAVEYGKTVETVTAELAGMPFDDILVLADPDAGCSFDETILRYADGTSAGPDVFVRINLFVRLWRMLGWGIQEVDAALDLFIPGDAPFSEGHFDQKPLETALIYLAHLKALDESVKVGRPRLTRLLTLWTDIPTTGAGSLYAQLFLTPGVLKSDKVFDHPHGDYLAEDWVDEQGQGKPADFVLVKGHLHAIQSALGLTADEVTEILKDAETSIEEAKLTMSNISVLHRYGMLAKALRISVRDLITLKSVSDKNPFMPLKTNPGTGKTTPITALADDRPYTQTMEFVAVVEMVKQSGLSIADLDFLVRRRFDDTGPRRPDRPATLASLVVLADGIRAIRTDHAMLADSEAITEEFLQQKLGLLLSPVNTNFALSMLRGEETIDRATEMFFSDVLKKQQVREGVEAGFLGADSYPELFDPLAPLKTIDPDDSPEEIETKRADNEDILRQNRTELADRRMRIASAFLPVLQHRLIRQLAVQTLAAETGAEPALVERLITDAGMLSVTGNDGATLSLLEAFTKAAEDGVDADFYVSADGTVPRQDTVRQLAGADTALRPPKDTTNQDLPPANSARFNGFLVAPAAGPYRFYITLAEPGAKGRLTFDHLPTPTFLDIQATAAIHEFGFGAAEYVDLQAGVPYRFAFDLDELNEKAGRLTVQGATTPRGPLSQLRLYPANGLEAAEAAHTRLLATLELLAGLGLTLREAAHMTARAVNWGEVNFADLPIKDFDPETEDHVATRKRFAWLLRLFEYAQLKREFAGGTDGLIDIFEANGTGAADRLATVYEHIGKLARRDQAVVQATAEALSPIANPDFADDRPLSRLWDALKLVERFGAPAAAIQRWTRIAALTTGLGAPSNDERFAIAREVKDTVKARFDAETWLRVAQPIFDRLRKQQRDALVATIMHREKFARMEQLYEHFLVDPGMEPVVQTSRIRLAIASVQLFIQRCLLNLENQVHPTAILNAEQGDWMKRYRVWEANRKIFLFPENWLEEEFRDNKTHLFEELQSALTENDVSPDVTETAFLKYLTGLAAIAKLEIVAAHLESKPDFAKNTLHVFGRTHSTPHKYFYRRYANPVWTPWEPVSADIDGDHLAPVVWRDRLYLFWVTFVESGRTDGETPANADDLTAMPTSKRDVEAHLHWSEYVAGDWQTPESGGYAPPKELRVRAQNLDSFDPQTVFVHVDVVDPPDIGAESPANLEKVGVYISLSHPFNDAFYLASRHSSPERRESRVTPSIAFGVDTAAAKRRPTAYVGAGGKLTASLHLRILTGPGQAGADVKADSLAILDTTGPFTLLPINNDRISMGVATDAIQGADGTEQEREQVKNALENNFGEIASLIRPVFFQDAHQVLFVEPTVNERTIQQWEDWMTRTPAPEPDAPAWHLDPNFWAQNVKPVFAKPDFDPIGPVAKYPFENSLVQPNTGMDWLVNPGTGLLLDGEIIGSRGRASVEMIAATDVQAATAMGAVPITINAGSSIAPGAFVMLSGANVEAGVGITQLNAGMNIVGGAGLNTALRQNVDSFKTEVLSGLPGRSDLMQ